MNTNTLPQIGRIDVEHGPCQFNKLEAYLVKWSKLATISVENAVVVGHKGL